MNSRALLVIIMLTALAGAAITARQNTTTPMPPLVTLRATGSYVFEFYCASCHGKEGRGDGPMREALKVPASDLTRLTARNAGTFPRRRVEAFITQGTPGIPAHGSGDMPVWGPVFRAMESSDTEVERRIAALVEFLESIQSK